jgi:chaperone modulatory protein CbpM
MLTNDACTKSCSAFRDSIRGDESRVEKMWASDLDLDEPLTLEVVAETVGAKRSVVMRLVERGLIDTVESDADEPRVPRRMVIQLRRMQRLRRDLGVNYAGAAVICDLVERIEQLNRELADMNRRLQ